MQHTNPIKALRRFGILALICGAAAPSVAQTPSQRNETYGSWTVQCAQSTDGLGCRMVQDLAQDDTNQRIVLASFVKLSDAALRLTVVAPFGLSLPEGVTLSVGTQTLSTMVFQTCERIGCFARTALDDDTLAWLRAGNTLTLSTKTADGRTLRFELSLNGFTQAEARLIALSDTTSSQD